MMKIAEKGGEPPCPAGGYRSALVWHYSEPGKGTGMNDEWYSSDFCGGESDKKNYWAHPEDEKQGGYHWSLPRDLTPRPHMQALTALVGKPDAHHVLAMGICGAVLLATLLGRFRRRIVPLQAPLLG